MSGLVWVVRELGGFSWCVVFKGTFMISGTLRSFSLSTQTLIAPLMLQHQAWLPDWSIIVGAEAAEKPVEEEMMNNVSSCQFLLLLPLSAYTHTHAGLLSTFAIFVCRWIYVEDRVTCVCLCVRVCGGGDRKACHCSDWLGWDSRVLWFISVTSDPHGPPSLWRQDIVESFDALFNTTARDVSTGSLYLQLATGKINAKVQLLQWILSSASICCILHL